MKFQIVRRDDGSAVIYIPYQEGYSRLRQMEEVLKYFLLDFDDRPIIEADLYKGGGKIVFLTGEDVTEEEVDVSLQGIVCEIECRRGRVQWFAEKFFSPYFPQHPRSFLNLN